ncbi:MAG: site-2 protease family protein [Ilumatobacteraceae bacterium]
MLPIRSRGPRRGLSLLGFPTSVRPGFPLFLVLIGLLYPFPLGAWVAACLAVFTVVHELGHAVVARAFGCEARISLDFMVAYATFSPAPGLTRARRAAIAVAGPASQMVLAAGIILLAGASPLSSSDISASDALTAVWWTGIALGAVNLIPLVPLDGGAVMTMLLDSLFPGRGAAIMLRASVVITATVLGWMIVTGTSGLLVFFAFLLWLQWRTLRGQRMLAVAASRAVSEPTGIAPVDAVAAEQILGAAGAAAAMSYCRRAFSQCPSSEVAVAAAQAACALGDREAALRWVAAAVNLSFDGLDTLARLNSAEGFGDLRADPRYATLIDGLGN